MSKRKPPIKTYTVDFDLICSHDITVKARTSSEAVKKALAKLAPGLARMKYWRIYWEDENGRVGGREGKGY